MDNLEETYNEYDESRRILEIIRESKHSKNKGKKSFLMTEAIQPDRIELEPNDRKGEEKKFREIISPRVEFNKFIIYPKSGNVEWSGKFQDSGVEWNYSLDDTRGVYITTSLLRLDDSTLETIKKLVGFYENWADEWANKIADEYRKIEDEISGEETEESEDSEEEIGRGL